MLSPLNSFNSTSKSSHTDRMISSKRVRCLSVNTLCRYFVTKTKCACVCSDRQSQTNCRTVSGGPSPPAPVRLIDGTGRGAAETARDRRSHGRRQQSTRNHHHDRDRRGEPEREHGLPGDQLERAAAWDLADQVTSLRSGPIADRAPAPRRSPSSRPGRTPTSASSSASVSVKKAAQQAAEHEVVALRYAHYLADALGVGDRVALQECVGKCTCGGVGAAGSGDGYIDGAQGVGGRDDGQPVGSGDRER